MRLRFFVFFIFLIVVSRQAEATHIVGADMTYKCVGPDHFEFTLNVYRDCEGIPVQPSYRVDYSSLSCNRQGYFTVVMKGGPVEISPVCPGLSTTCKGGSQPGIQKYVYKGTFNIPMACTDWVFSWRDCNRNSAITNIVNPDNQCLYIEATLNNVEAPCNNSPAFNNIPVSFLCAGQGNFINPGTVESDGDQLNFLSVIPRSGRFTNVTYKSSFSASNPLTSNPGFSLNSQSGDISLHPVNVGEISVTAIVAEERRNGVLVGSVMRDIQLIVQNCNNAIPILSGINNTAADSISVCAGDQVCFNVFGRDLDPGQVLNMTWNYGIDTPRAEFVVTGTPFVPKGTFCWETAPWEAGLYFFTVTLRDDFCPIVGTTTKSYKIRVNPGPTISLPDINVGCSDLTQLTPVITNSKPPYTYKWSSGETTSSVTKGPGIWRVTVTDSRGCVGFGTAFLRSGLIPGFEEGNLCQGQLSYFNDTSKTLVGNITSWQWNFGDPASGANNTSTLQNPTHQFTSPGIYLVTLTVRDDRGCQETITKPVKYCDIPVPNFIYTDSCESPKPLPYIDRTSVSVCGLKYWILDFGDGRSTYCDFGLPFPPVRCLPNYYFPGDPFYWNYIDSPPLEGVYNVTLTVINENDCEESITKQVRIHPRPYVDILQDDYYFRCNKPDTTLTSINWGGLAPRTVRWNTGATSSSININSIGSYGIQVTDARGCINLDMINVMDPLIPAFNYTSYCEPDDPIQFIDNTFSEWGIVQWDWNFGDNTTFSTTNPALKNPSHVYAADGVYPVRLTVRDVTNCVRTTVRNFIRELPDNHFVVEPSPLCLGQLINIESPRGRHIDSLIWTFETGDTIFVSRHKYRFPEWETPPNVVPLQYDAETEFFYFNSSYLYQYGAGDTFTVQLVMFYNDTACSRIYKRDVRIFSPLDVTIDSIQGFCTDDPTWFYASQHNITDPGNEVTSWRWNFYMQVYHHEHHHYHMELIDSAFTQNPVMTFTEHGNYFAELVVTNGDGCEVLTPMMGFSVIKIPVPTFCLANPCAKSQTRFFYFCMVFPEIAIDSVYWDFGDGNTSNVFEPFHIYADSGTYNVRVAIYNSSFGCYNENTIPVHIFLSPEADFTAENACLGDPVQFTDLSLPSPGESIIGWQWNFGNGDSSDVQHPAYIYPDSGTYFVRLGILSSSTGCVDTIVKQVIVRPLPVAGFSFVANELVVQRPIRFIDESLGGVRWLWAFGDGDSLLITDPLNRNPEHTYAASFRNVEVTQVVYNEYNCTDTARYTLDLNVGLILPVAFSPNGDGNNDGLFLFYKGIEELLEFRIYNRWGEKVFDANGDLNAAWDGKYQNVDQPLGVYVYYVRARTFLKDEISLSGKVTLIR